MAWLRPDHFYGCDKGHPGGGGALEVRFAHPVRLSPDTRSQGHGRPCLQRRHRCRGFCCHVVFPDGHFHDMLLENPDLVKKSRRIFLQLSFLKAIRLKKTAFLLEKSWISYKKSLFWATKCRFWDILCEKLKILFVLI